jgi:eukaryotic-like serine/threonine-protein kinase
VRLAGHQCAHFSGCGQERFRREARAAARLHHTNIVPVFEVGHEGDVCYYAMQLIAGQSLHQVIDELRRIRHPASGPNHSTSGSLELDGTAPEDAKAAGISRASVLLLTGPVTQQGETTPDALPTVADAASSSPATSAFSGTFTKHDPYYRSVARIGQQAAQALAYAHARGIVHRDVKSANLLLDESGVVWVTDLGLAKSEDDQLTRTGELPGTLRYMAPERFGGQCDARADVYALGLTLYELLVLQPAFPAGDRLHLLENIRNHEPARPRAVDKRVPRDLETVVLKAIEKDPLRRYASADEMAEDLRRFLADEPLRARRTRWHERGWRWCRRNPAVAGLLAAVAFSLVLGLVATSGFAVLAQQDRDRARNAEAEGKRKLFESYTSEADAIRMSHRPGQRFGALRRVRAALDVGAEIGLRDEDKLRLRNVAVAALCLPDLEPGLEWEAGRNKPLPEVLDPLFRRNILRSDYIIDHLPAPVHELKNGWPCSPDGRFTAVATEEYIKRTSVPAQI